MWEAIGDFLKALRLFLEQISKSPQQIQAERNKDIDEVTAKEAKTKRPDNSFWNGG